MTAGRSAGKLPTMLTRPFDDVRFARRLELALAAAQRGAADPTEVLAAAARVADGDADAWLGEWTATAGAAWSAARDADRDGHGVSALAHYRRAATYYAAVLPLIPFTSEPERELALWRRQRACWERVVDLAGAERLAVPYGATTLPAYVFTAPDAEAGEPRPLVLVHGDGDEPTSQSWLHGGAAAAERGYHWATFDGPGQGAALVTQGLTARPDWESVLTPVLDALAARPDVDPVRVAVIGTGRAGYAIPRALAFEHRFAAAVVDPGVVDVSTAWTAALTPTLRAALDRGDAAAFDRDMHLTELIEPECTQRLRALATPYGLEDGSRFRLFTALAAYRLDGELAGVRTPVLIIHPDGEERWPGQSRRLFERLPGPRELAPMTGEDHAGPVGECRVFDWLDARLAA